MPAACKVSLCPFSLALTFPLGPHLSIGDHFLYCLISRANGYYTRDILHVSLPPALVSVSVCLKKMWINEENQLQHHTHMLLLPR